MHAIKIQFLKILNTINPTAKPALAYFCPMQRSLRRLIRIELVLIYLVIIAGSVVRMTGSGMGCPDWPKCFGYLIPPTEHAQLEWQAQRDFKKGQIIIVNESLKVAKADFTTATAYAEENWETYTKHDYAQFNPAHTWTEYINRLVGALAGVPMFILFVWTLFGVRKNPINFLLAASGLFLLGFEAWLGKLVVDGNLIPGSITIHMFGALAIVVVLLLLLERNRNTRLHFTMSKPLKTALFFAVILTLIQILMGTQVREQVDVLYKSGLDRMSWVEQLDFDFYFHRSFSLAVLALNGWLFYRFRKANYHSAAMQWIITLIGIEIILGIVLSYMFMPKWAQPTHLVLGAVLFGVQVHLLISSLRKKST